MGCIGSKLTVDIYDPVSDKIEKKAVSSLVSKKRSSNESNKRFVILEVDRDGGGTICTRSTSGSDSAASGDASNASNSDSRKRRKTNRKNRDGDRETLRLIEEIERNGTRKQQQQQKLQIVAQGYDSCMVFEEIELVLESCCDNVSSIGSENSSSSGISHEKEELLSEIVAAAAAAAAAAAPPPVVVAAAAADVVAVPDKQRIQMRQDKAFLEHITRVSSTRRNNMSFGSSNDERERDRDRDRSFRYTQS